MAVYRHNGGQVFSLPCDVEFFQLTFGPIKKQRRSLTHHLRQNNDNGNMSLFYVNKTQKFLWRPEALRHLRIHQWYRYYKTMPTNHRAQNTNDEFAESSSLSPKSGAGFTHELHQAHDDVDDETNPNYDFKSSTDPVGTKYPYNVPGLPFECVRRENRHFGCIRSWMYNLSTVKSSEGRSERDHHYEALLFRSLPWYSDPNGDIECKVPTANSTSANSSTWQFTTISLNEIYSKQDDISTSKFERICMQLEKQFSQQSPCLCCQGHRRGNTTKPCWRCDSKFIPNGWHSCEYTTRPVWHPGTLWKDVESASEGYLLDLKEHGVKLEHIKKKGEELVKEEIFSNEKLKNFLELMAHEENLKVDTDKFSNAENQTYVHEKITSYSNDAPTPKNAEERKEQKQENCKACSIN